MVTITLDPNSPLAEFQQITRFMREHTTAHRWADGMVYFIGEAKRKGAIKIGWTKRDPQRRLYSLQTGNPTALELLGVLPGSRAREEMFHARYCGQRRQGEWFVPDEELWFEIEHSFEKPREVELTPELEGPSSECEICCGWRSIMDQVAPLPYLGD